MLFLFFWGVLFVFSLKRTYPSLLTVLLLVIASFLFTKHPFSLLVAFIEGCVAYFLCLLLQVCALWLLSFCIPPPCGLIRSHGSCYHILWMTLQMISPKCRRELSGAGGKHWGKYSISWLWQWLRDCMHLLIPTRCKISEFLYVNYLSMKRILKRVSVTYIFALIFRPTHTVACWR